MYGAPLVALKIGGICTIRRACCNHWDCPHCGQTRAAEEYHRIVWGAQVLEDEGRAIYFWTLTCRGRELEYDDAMAGYYEWTNKLLTSARAKCKRASQFWAYIQVTEHQKKTRAHPHSHIIITFCPDDAIRQNPDDVRTAITSEWFARANESAGLGSQNRISAVASAGAVASYVAKYLFKAATSEGWPPKWKRVRYSQNWPTPPKKVVEFSRVLSTPKDWDSIADFENEWICEDDGIYTSASKRLVNIRKRQGDLTF